jgi:VanZ family protein
LLPFPDFCTNLVFYGVTIRHKGLILEISKTPMLKLIIILRPFARYLLIAWALTIIIVSSIPNIPTLKIHTAHNVFRLDYLMHFSEYGILTFITFLSLAGNEFRMKYVKITLIMSGLIVFAYLDEFHQKIIPGRTYNIIDFLSNTSGIVVIAIVTVLLFRSIRIKNHS